VYPKATRQMMTSYLALGLGNEVGELMGKCMMSTDLIAMIGEATGKVQGKYKKLMRDGPESSTHEEPSAILVR